MRQRFVVLCTVMLAVLVAAASISAEPKGLKKKRMQPDEYGNVILYNRIRAQSESPVVFKHWLHRSKYTCRLCHVDVGFSMEEGRTGISCEDIKEGLYCGSCHNGNESFSRDGVSKINGVEVKNCDRCHSFGKNVPEKHEFQKFKQIFKPERFGNGLDWLRAEKYGRIKLKDFLPGVSIAREKLNDPKDSLILPRVHEKNLMPGIIFSHEKHAVWSGCELCHPEIFEVNKSEEAFSMQDVFDGKFCGACHGTVAFPNIDCRRCHTKEVY